VNTFGAAFGCLAAAFFLMERFGVRGTIWVAAAGNLLIAAAAFALARHYRRSAKEESVEPADDDEPATDPDYADPAPATPLHLGRMIFWGYALSGFVALGYEVVWTRMLSVLLRLTTSQSLSLILVAFLFGLAAGGAVGARVVDRLRNLPAAFGVAQLTLGLFGLGSIAMFGLIPRVMAALGSLPGVGGHFVRLLSVGLAVMLVPTLLMGFLFPLVGKLHARSPGNLGRRIGEIYAANTAGAILGAFVGGFVLLPLAGTRGSIQSLAWINLVVGAAVLMALPRARTAGRLATLGCATGAVLLFNFFVPQDTVVRLLKNAESRATLIYHDESVAGTVTVYEYFNGTRMLRVNGAGEVPTDPASLKTFRLLGNLPMLLHPDPQEVLVVAFGGGVTLAAVEAHRPRRLDCVEVVPGVLGAAPYFTEYNRGVFGRFDGERMRLLIEDGRNHVLRTEREYDVIISDATHPSTADSWVLYTEEFYELCRARLKQGGVVAQWLPLHGLSGEDYRMILRTFQTVFPHATMWMTSDYSVMLATPDPLTLDYREIEARLSDPDVQAGLAEFELGDPVSFLSSLTFGEQALEAFVQDGLTNTDDRPWVSFAGSHRSGSERGGPVLAELIPGLAPDVGAPLVGATAEEGRRLELRNRSLVHTYLAELALKVGDRGEAYEQLRRALAVDSTEPTARRHLERLERRERRRNAEGR